MGSPVLLTTTTCSIDGVSLTARSAFIFIGIFCLVPLTPVSWVTSTLHSESLIRSLSESLENAPNTTEWTAPILAHARTATANSGIICIYKHTLSPFLTPRSFKAFAN